MSSWRDRAEKIQSDWKERAKGRDSDITQYESAIRGGVQGLSLGFSDEATGAVEGLYDYARENLNGDGKGISLSEAYQQARDEARNNNKLAQAANPLTYGASELGASAATMFLPGLNVAKGATLAARAARSGLGGALAGAGLSEENSAEGVATDSLIGGAVGAGFQGLGEKVLAPVANKVGNWIQNSGPAKAIGKVFANVTPEQTERYLARQAQVNASRELEDIGQDFNQVAMVKMRDYLGQLDDDAWSVLSTKKNIKKEDVVNLGEDYIANLLGGKRGNLSRLSGTGADSDKIAAIKSQINEINNAYGKKLSQSDLKSIVQNLQKLGWSLEGDPKHTHQGQALRDLSSVYNETLKKLNPIYEAKMKPLAEATANMSSIEKQFINRNAPDQVDKFMRVAKKLDRPTVNTEALNSLRQMDGYTGEQVEDKIRDRLTFEAFERSTPNGSRMTLFGKTIGAAAGGAIGYGGTESGTGGAVGALAGFSADKYAGKFFKQMLNGQLAAKDVVQKVSPYLGKFAQPLIEAAKRGNSAVASTHFILSQTNPEYRNLVKKLDEEDASNE